MRSLQPRLLSPARVRELTSLSERDQRRRPGFPRAIRLGRGKTGRLAFLEAEIVEWIAVQVASRDLEPPPPPPPVKRPIGRPRKIVATRDSEPPQAQAIAAAPAEGGGGRRCG